MINKFFIKIHLKRGRLRLTGGYGGPKEGIMKKWYIGFQKKLFQKKGMWKASGLTKSLRRWGESGIVTKIILFFFK